MEIHKLVEKAFKRDLSDPSALNDAFDALRLLEPEDFSLAHEKNKEVRRLSAKCAKERTDVKMFELNKRALLFDAPYDSRRIVCTLSGTGQTIRGSICHDASSFCK